MTLMDLVIILGYPIGLFVVGISLARRLGGADPLVSVPTWIRALVGGMALGGPWLLYWSGYLRGLAVPADSFVPLTLAVVLWLGADRLVGMTAHGTESC